MSYEIKDAKAQVPSSPETLLTTREVSEFPAEASSSSSSSAASRLWFEFIFIQCRKSCGSIKRSRQVKLAFMHQKTSNSWMQRLGSLTAPKFRSCRRLGRPQCGTGSRHLISQLSAREEESRKGCTETCPSPCSICTTSPAHGSARDRNYRGPHTRQVTHYE